MVAKSPGVGETGRVGERHKLVAVRRTGPQDLMSGMAAVADNPVQHN